MTAIEQLAEFVSGLAIAQVPPATLDQLRLHLFDTLGATIIGGKTAEARAMVDLVQDTGGAGDVLAPGLALRTSVSLAAMASCAATRCTEVDDIHLTSCTTPGSVIVPTALALARWQPDVDAETFLAALLAGYELMTRFGRAADGPNILYRGVWPTYLCGGIGAAAVTARFLGLSAQETAGALATAVTMALGTAGGQPVGLTSRWLTLGCTVQSAILATLAARRGIRGDTSILDGRWSQITGIAIDGAALLDGLGASFEMDRISIKPYCAGKQTMAALCGFVQLLDEERLNPAAIEQVVVSVPSRYAAMINGPVLPGQRPVPTRGAQHILALAAYHREDLLNVLRPRSHPEPDIPALMEKIQVEMDESLAQHYPAAWPARVEIRTGSRHMVREIIHAKGDPGDPFGWDDDARKVERVLRGIADQTSVERLADVCRDLGTTTSPADVLGALGTIERA